MTAAAPRLLAPKRRPQEEKPDLRPPPGGFPKAPEEPLALIRMGNTRYLDLKAAPKCCTRMRFPANALGVFG